MKALLQSQIKLFKELNIPSQSGLIFAWVLSIIITSYVIILMAIPQYQTAAPRGIVFALDNDGGRAVEVSMQTRWYNSNHFAPYGNVYYRLSHTLADLVSFQERGLTPKEQREFTHDLALKLISVFSLVGIGAFLGWTLFGFSWIVPLFSAAFLLLISHDPLWAYWTYRPHPEHLVTLMAVAAFYYFAKYLKSPEEKKIFIVSALLWGLAMAVKRTTSIFIPGLLIVLIFPYKKENLVITAKYVGYMLLAYLVIGFPQNFGFYKHTKFLLYESSLHSAADIESISNYLKLIGGQLVYLCPLIVIGHFFSENNEKLISPKLFIFFFLSFIPLLARKMSFNGDRHTFLLSGTSTVLLLIILNHMNPFRVKKFSSIIMAFLMVVAIKLMGMPKAYAELRDADLSCVPYMNKIISYLQREMGPSKKLVKEPFFPYNEKIEENTRVYWGITWEDITPETWYLGTQKITENEYSSTPPLDFYGKRLENFNMKQLFYRTIRGKTEFTMPDSRKFKKIISDDRCDYDLWERFE